jgi:Asp-tRNA(Asn)/Glu-tRNA(Gln) amidotransferase A subunit family amidase
MQENIDIEALKNDKEFQENLKKLEEEVAQSNSLAKAYQLLDTKLAIMADEEEINELFNKVVQNAFEQVSSKIAEGGELDLSNPDEWAAARAIYEHAIERFSANDKKAAQELFLALHHLINHPEVKDAMMVHAAAVGKGYSFDDFFNKLTNVEDKDFNDPMAVFVTDFVQPVDILLEMMKDEVQKLQARLDKLKQAQENS